MRLDEEYCLSEYVDLGRLGDNEKVHIVRNQVNGVIGVRKYVALDLEEIYLFLKENPNVYIPKIYECIQTDTNLIGSFNCSMMSESSVMLTLFFNGFINSLISFSIK